MICSYCKAESLEVKDNGWEYCPNPMCESPGADWSKFYLKSYSPSNQTYRAWDLIQFVVDWLVSNTELDPFLRTKIQSDVANRILSELGNKDAPSFEGEEQEA